MEFGRTHRSAGRVDDEAFAVDDGESPESVKMPDRNTFRYGGDGYSYWRSSMTGWESRFQAEAVGDSREGLERDGWV